MKELELLLEKLEKETFSGREISHEPTKIDMHFSPGKLVYEYPQKKESIEFGFDKDYEVHTYCFGPDDNMKCHTEEEIKGYKNHGLLSNYLKRDPRYLLRNSTDHKKLSEGVYSFKVWDDKAKEGSILGITQYADISLENGALKRLIVKNRFKNGKEKIFAEVLF